ncbi:MAG: hypothetical protein NTV51_12570 [Verrucomicrobia bacterium]|nr:hypothetical protein [Verrucomicrobiota bacterium]
MESALAQAMISSGFGDGAARTYAFLLGNSGVGLEAIAVGTGLRPPDAGAAVDALCKIMVVGKDRMHEREVFYAEEPKTAWRAIGIDWVWRLANQPEDYQHDATLRLPDSIEPTTEDSRHVMQRMEAIAAAAVPLYRPRARLVRLHEWRIAASEEQATLLLVDALRSASKRIRATGSGRRLPTVPQIWPVLTERIAAGIRYERVAELREAFEHGLSIVERDIEEAGVRVWYGDGAKIRHSAYVIDDDIVVMLRKDEGGGPIVGSFTRRHVIVARYRKTFQNCQAAALPGPFVAAELRKETEARLGELRDVGCSPAEMDWMRCVVGFGTWCGVQPPSAVFVQRMERERYLCKGTTGKWVFNFRTTFAALNSRWSSLQPEQRSKYEYDSI